MKLSSYVNKRFKEVLPTSLCSYALKYENGKIAEHIFDVCFARAIHYQYGEKQGIGDIVEVAMSLKNYREYGKETETRKRVPKLFPAYASYILNRSMFKDVFLTKNMQSAFRNGVDLDVDQGHSYCVTAMMALREGWEFPYLLEGWTFLTKNGFDEDFAYIVSRMFAAEGNKVYKRSFGGHQTISMELSVSNAKLLFKKGCNKKGESFRKSRSKYEIYKTTLSDKGGFKNNFHDYIFKDCKMLVSGNWNEISYVNLDEFIENLRKVEKEIMS